MTTQKAVNYLSERGELPGICADSFPVVPKTETIVVERTVKDDSAVQVLEEQNAMLQKRLDYIEQLEQDTMPCYDKLQRLASKYSSDVKALQESNRKLQQRLSNIKVNDTTTVKTVPDSARIKALLLVVAEKDKVIADKQQKLEKAEEKAKRRGQNFAMALAGGILSFAGLAVVLFRRKK